MAFDDERFGLFEDVEDEEEVDRELVSDLVTKAAERGFRAGWVACNQHREARFIAVGLTMAAKLVRELEEMEEAQMEADAAGREGYTQ